MLYAKISTAKTVTLGPVLAADGTMSNGALAYTDFKIFKNGIDFYKNYFDYIIMGCDGIFEKLTN